MMYPPIFALCSSDSDVQSYLGSSPCRFYPVEAPEGVAKPYSVWLDVGGNPENYISNTPDIDTFTIKVETFGETIDDARNSMSALRSVIEQHAHVTAYGGEGKDPDTNLYVYTLIADWIVSRTLPGIPFGYYYVIDSDGNYVTDSDGNYVIVGS